MMKMEATLPGFEETLAGLFSIVIEGYENLPQHVGINTPSRIINRITRIVDIDERIFGGVGY
ncbi:hypothetical protein CSA56_08035 [candidate division KSB3 bacterium]|uniref:Uncharacterized protein n=1 Tax=candidate division KSB3 bacterium TaxID=2044937 RepID=A0A2G6KF69_9BACT|nr:MAG: hypothetical protein CSA56_08035 [candidate division KSB3 bacterium]